MTTVRQRQLFFQNYEESYYNHQVYLLFTALWIPLLNFYFGLGRCQRNESMNVKDHQRNESMNMKDHQSSWNNIVFTCILFSPHREPFHSLMQKNEPPPPQAGSDFNVTCWSREQRIHCYPFQWCLKFQL